MCGYQIFEYQCVWPWEHTTINAYIQGSIVKACEHGSKWSSRHVSIGACDYQGMSVWAFKHVSIQACEKSIMWTWEHTIIKTCRHVSGQACKNMWAWEHKGMSACDHQSIQTYLCGGIQTWEHIRSSKHVNIEVCDHQSKYTCEQVIIQVSTHVRTYKHMRI